MNQRQSASGNALPQLLQAVAAAWRRKDYQQGIENLKRASKLDPLNVNILLDLGCAYGMRYEYATAEKYLEQACRLAPGARKAEALTAAGIRSLEFHRVEMAQGYFQRALEVQGDSAEILVALAESYERTHHLEDAVQMADRALGLKTTYEPATLVRGRLARKTGDLADAEARLRRLTEKSEGDTWTRSRAWYELGGVLDRQGRYDEAMSAFLSAKELVRPSAGPASAAMQDRLVRLKQMEANLTDEMSQRWHAEGATLEPRHRFVLLCGHPRSGTTLLEQALDAHPGIVSVEETDILADEAWLPLKRSFATTTAHHEVLDSTPESGLKEARENYFRCAEKFLGEPLRSRLLIDKNPSLNGLIPAVARIFPEAKFLVAIRDPRDVCLSCFMQSLAITPVSVAYLSLEETAKAYAAEMNFLRAVLPRLKNPYLEVRYEDVVNDLASSLRRVLEFLEVDWNDRVLRFDQHAQTKIVRSPTYADVKKPVFKTSVARWQHYQKYLEPCLPTLEPFVKAFGYE